FVPDGGDVGLTLFHESEAEKGAALHGVTKSFSLVGGFGDFLEFADGFLEQAHLAEGDAKVVVRFEIFFLAAHFAEFRAKLVENLRRRAGLGRCGWGRRRGCWFLGGGRWTRRREWNRRRMS